MAVPRITKEDLKQRLDAGDAPVILDARLKYPYEHSTLTLPGAIRVTPATLPSLDLPAGRDVVVYDSDPDEIVSAPIVAALIARGFRAYALKGGIAEWVTANLPTATKEPRRTTPAGAGADRA